jgi:hypothetical protein
MSWTVWYIQAVLQLAPAESKDLLVRLLAEPEYELDAAWGLFQLARTDRPSQLVWPRNWPMRSKDFSFVWNARAGDAETSFVEALRAELADVLRKHIEGLVAERSRAEKSDNFDFRLKQLAVVLAEMDGRSSFQLVLDILSFPETGTWLYGGWSRIHGLEALLMNGVVLPSAKTWEILEPVIQHARAHRYNSQQSSLLTHALCVVLFTDDGCSDITRVRQMLQENLLAVEGLRQLTKAAGYSRCNDAVGLLRELAESKIRAQHLGDTWIDAVAQFDTEEARNLLLGFVDPSLPTVPSELIAHYDGRLVARLAEIARRDSNVRTRLFALADSDISPKQATLLGKVLAELGSTDAILRALNLLKDDGPSAVSFELQKRIEEAFVEHRPYQGSTNTFTLVPRSSNAIRSKLLDMVKNDPKRRKSAFALLSQIESWRMEHGRPDGEPRNPGLAEGILWPPEPPI